jgi:hypothetical protein
MKTPRSVRLLAAAAAVAALLQLGGCATPATSQAMTVKPGSTAPVNPKLKGAVALGTISGGKDTSPLWTSQVDNEGFRKALKDSLAVTGYLAPEGTKPSYTVDADLQSLDQPLMGFTFDVKSTVKYNLRAPAGAKAMPVVATGTATTSDAFVAVERLRLANERSILENIKEFINQLGRYAD